MYEMPQKVLFKHCDPAGIVFFPRYFEMMNDCVEAFFDEALGWPFESFHQVAGIPTASIATKFMAPSRHGDRLMLGLHITRIGGASFDYLMTARCGDELRFQTNATLVHVDNTGKPSAVPESIKQRLRNHMKEQT